MTCNVYVYITIQQLNKAFYRRLIQSRCRAKFKRVSYLVNDKHRKVTGLSIIFLSLMEQN